MCFALLVLLITLFLLQREDMQERLQEAQKFHFDAM